MNIIQGDSLEVLKTLPDNFCDLVVTSPPYNKNYWLRNRNQKGKRIITYDSFNDSLDPQEYIQQQTDILNELVRVIKPTGSIFYNHIDILHKHNTIHPSYVYNFNVKQVIVWDRGNTPKLDKSYFLPTTEWVFWIKKSWDAIPYFDKSQAQHKKSIWRINKEKNNPHPAPFPQELVDNIIKSCSVEGSVVMDCYMGSGSTALSCKRNNREFVGIEISETYIDMTKKRLDEYKVI
jgi:site-specific DNA-methyltransferase (adenine-specific)